MTHCRQVNLSPDELNTSLSFSYLRQTLCILTDLFRANKLLTMSLVQAVVVFTCMMNHRCKQ